MTGDKIIPDEQIMGIVNYFIVWSKCPYCNETIDGEITPDIMTSHLNICILNLDLELMRKSKRL